MEGTLKINGKELKITLTDGQEKLIKKAFAKKITDVIKTFEDACAETGEDPQSQKFLVGTPDDIAYQKIKVIARALNEGTTLSYANSDQKKWYPWFEYSGSGFRFFASYFGYTITDSAGGSRLCFHSQELAKYAGTQFIEIYNQLLN